MRDLRDPVILGEVLIEWGEEIGKPLSSVYDINPAHFERAPDYVDPPVLERYGDPVAQHEAKIARGEAVRLP